MVTKIVGVVCLLIAVFQFFIALISCLLTLKQMAMVTHHISY